MSAKKRTKKASVTPRPHPITPAAEPKRISDEKREAFATRDERWAVKLNLKEYRKLDMRETARLAVCQEILDRCRGSNSPFENFFDSLVVDVMNGDWPTPQRVENLLNEFRLDWESMDHSARLFVETYPAKPEAAEQTDAA